MTYLLPSLETKKDIDRAIKGCEDKVLILRFGREADVACMQLDDIVSDCVSCERVRAHAQAAITGAGCLDTSVYSEVTFAPMQLAKNSHAVSQMAAIYTVNADRVPVYTQYFDITLIPATVFFFNGQHMKVDWG